VGCFIPSRKRPPRCSRVNVGARALRDLAARTGKARTSEEALELPLSTPSEHNLDVPFALSTCRCQQCERRTDAGTASLPEALAIRATNLESGSLRVWPLLDVVRTQQVGAGDDLTSAAANSPAGPILSRPKRRCCYRSRLQVARTRSQSWLLGSAPASAQPISTAPSTI